MALDRRDDFDRDVPLQREVLMRDFADDVVHFREQRLLVAWKYGVDVLRTHEHGNDAERGRQALLKSSTGRDPALSAKVGEDPVGFRNQCTVPGRRKFQVGCGASWLDPILLNRPVRNLQPRIVELQGIDLRQEFSWKSRPSLRLPVGEAPCNTGQSRSTHAERLGRGLVREASD